MKKVNNWWITDLEETKWFEYWPNPEQWQNYFCEFTVDYFCPGPRRVCLDVGANIGQTTIGFSPYFQKIISFEPNPPVYECLLKNIEEHNLKNVNTHRIGIGDVVEKRDFKYNHIKPGTSRFLENGEKAGGSAGRRTNIKIETLDNFLFKNTEVDLIKIDVEGYEEKVVTGAKNLLLNHKPTVVLEVRPLHIETHKPRIDKFMRQIGYTCLYKRRTDYYYVHDSKAEKIVTRLLSDKEKNNWE